MKILIVSMRSIHTTRWVNQLKESKFQVYYFDILSGGYIPELDWVTQFSNWKYKFGNFKGRTFLKKKFPKIHSILEKDTEKEFQKVLDKVKPDLVHSFALYVSCTPILKTMLQREKLKWAYSSWGSDLFYFQNIPEYLKDIKKVLPRINYLFTDCNRDFKVAKDLGFKNEFLGVFPGGGGFDFDEIDKYITPLHQREIILIKGYQGRSGRAINALNALTNSKSMLKKYQLVIFGADEEVAHFIKNSKLSDWDNIELLGKVKREKVLEIMGKSLIYIGNSNSDGMPNTLLEAICLGCFPIQSNPGRVTEEVIRNKENGFLIQDPENSLEISNLLKCAILDSTLKEKAFKINLKEIKPRYAKQKIQSLVLESYNQILD